MVRVEDLGDLVGFYLRRAEWDILESLYLFALHFEPYDVRDNIKKKYGSDRSAEIVYKRLEELLGDMYMLYNHPEDSDLTISEILKSFCAEAFPPILTDNVINSLNNLGITAKRFIFLLYKYGEILKGRIGSVDYLPLYPYEIAYSVIFGNHPGDREEDIDLGNIENKLIKAGLIYSHWSSSRKHTYHELIVPPYAMEVWRNLPSYLALPKIEINERW